MHARGSVDPRLFMDNRAAVQSGHPNRRKTELEKLVYKAQGFNPR